MTTTKFAYKYQTAFLCTIFAIINLTTLFGQSAHLLGRKDGSLERLYLESIREGYIPPTTVQTISEAEARFYGLIGTKTHSTEPFWKGGVSIQPFVVGWYGIESTQWDEGYSRRLADFSLINRLTLNEPILSAHISFGSDSFYATTAVDFSTDSLIKYIDSNGVLGFWEPMEYFSWWTFPKEAYLSWSTDQTTVAAGRFPTGIGLGNANLFLNGQAFWYDQLQFSWWSKNFRFFAMWGTSSSHLSKEEYAIQTNTNPYNTDDNLGWDANDNHNHASQSIIPFKMFTYHRLEFKPLTWLGLGLGEMQMIGGKVPEMSNLLPGGYWHNTYSSGNTNVMMIADLWTVPLPGLLIYGEFLMDDSRAPSEGHTSKPNCWGWEAGATAVLPVAPSGWNFSLNVEYSHVDAWTYGRWQPYLTMYQRQILTGGWSGIDIPLGHPEGNDVNQAGIRFTALGKESRRIEFGYTWISKGPLYLGRIETLKNSEDEDFFVPVYFDYDDWAGSGELKRITGSTRKYSHVFSLRCVWPILNQLTLDSEIDYRIIQNYAHKSGKTQTETVIKTGLIWKYDKKTEKRVQE